MLTNNLWYGFGAVITLFTSAFTIYTYFKPKPPFKVIIHSMKYYYFSGPPYREASFGFLIDIEFFNLLDKNDLNIESVLLSARTKNIFRRSKYFTDWGGQTLKGKLTNFRYKLLPSKRIREWIVFKPMNFYHLTKILVLTINTDVIVKDISIGYINRLKLMISVWNFQKRR